MTSPSGLWIEGDTLSPTNLNRRSPVGIFPAKTYHVAWATGTGTTQINNAIVNAAAGGYTAVYVDASRFPYDATAVTFNNTIHMLREGGNLTLDEYDIVAYGADSSGVVDSYAAVQQAFNAAAQTDAASQINRSHTIRVPSGRFSLSRPIIVSGQGLSIVGNHQGLNSEVTGIRSGSSILQNSHYGGPILLVQAAATTVKNFVTSLVTGAGNAFSCTADNWGGTGTRAYFNLRDLLDLHGLAAFSVEFFYQSSTPVTNSAIIGSGGFHSDQTVRNCFLLKNETGTPTFQLQLSTSGTVSVTGTANISDGAVHHVAGTYDGSTARLFVDGALIGSTACSGTLVQFAFEEMLLGEAVGALCAESGVQFINGPRGIIDSVRLSRAATYTAAFTAPTAKLATNANTLALLNFDEQIGITTRVQTASGDAWLPQRSTSFLGQSAGLNIDGICFDTLHGGTSLCVFFGEGAPWWKIHKCNFNQFRRGIWGGVYQNTFGWALTHTSFHNTIGSLTAMTFGTFGGIGLASDIWLWGSPIDVMISGADVRFESVFFQSTAYTQMFVLATAQTTDGQPIHFEDCGFNCENAASGTFLTNCRFISSGNVAFRGLTFDNCVIETRWGQPYVQGFGHDTFNFKNCTFTDLTGTTTSIINVAGTPSANNPIRPALVENCKQISSWIPWSNATGTAMLGRIGPLFSAATGGTLNFDANIADEWDLTLTSDVTQSAWTKISYGQPVSGVIKMDSTGSRLFTWPTNSKGTVELSYGSAAINTFSGFYDGVNVILTSVRTGL